MSIVRWVGLLTLALLALGGHAPAAEPAPLRGSISLSRTSAEVGQRVEAEITIPGGGDIQKLEFRLPDEMKPKLAVGNLKRGSPERFTADWRGLIEGTHLVENLEARATLADRATTTVQFGPVTLIIKPVLGEATMELQDYTDPHDIPPDYTLRNAVYTAGGLASLGLLAALFLAGRRFLRRRAEALAYRPPVPPIDRAMTDLAELMRLEIFTTFGAERHYTRLSNILREYLERDTGSPVLEMTEDELIEEIRHGIGRRRAGADALVPVLRRSSMAKFARQVLDRDQALGDCREVAAFLESEKARLAALAAERKAAQQEAGAA